MLAGLCSEAGEGAAAVWGAAFGEGRFAAILRSEDNFFARIVRTPATQLTVDDAYSYACWLAPLQPASAIGGYTQVFAEAGFAKTIEFVMLLTSEDPILSP